MHVAGSEGHRKMKKGSEIKLGRLWGRLHKGLLKFEGSIYPFVNEDKKLVVLYFDYLNVTLFSAAPSFENSGGLSMCFLLLQTIN